MISELSKAARRHNGTASGDVLSPTDRSTGYLTFPIHLQEPTDVVGLLAARSRVAPATIRAQLAAWQIGGAA